MTDHSSGAWKHKKRDSDAWLSTHGPYWLLFTAIVVSVGVVMGVLFQ